MSRIYFVGLRHQDGDVRLWEGVLRRVKRTGMNGDVKGSSCGALISGYRMSKVHQAILTVSRVVSSATDNLGRLLHLLLSRGAEGRGLAGCRGASIRGVYSVAIFIILQQSLPIQ